MFGGSSFFGLYGIFFVINLIIQFFSGGLNDLFGTAA
jgi:hypothetical protein